MALSVDGTANSGVTDTASISTTLTTTLTNDIIVVVLSYAGGSALTASISDTAGLTWNTRYPVTATAAVGTPGTLYIAEYWAYSPNVLSSDVITVALSATVYANLCAFGVNGANTTAPFDTNTSLPSLASSKTSNAFSTNSSSDLILCLMGSNSSITSPTGITNINSGLSY